MQTRIRNHIRGNVAGYVALFCFVILAWSAAAEAVGKGNSGATVTASFAASCTDLEAHSSKDISHVEIHYADGRVVKDEVVHNPDFAIDGGAGATRRSAVRLRRGLASIGVRKQPACEVRVDRVGGTGPAAAASTTAFLSVVASPAANTPGTLVRPSSSMTIAPDSSSLQPSCAGSGLGVKLGMKKSPVRSSVEPSAKTTRASLQNAAAP